MFDFYRLQDFQVHGKRVIVRVDFNVPLSRDCKIVEDSSRIEASLPTLRYLLDNGARVIVMSHLGRPKGKVCPDFSLKPVRQVLETLLHCSVKLYPLSSDTVHFVSQMKNGEIVLLENLRFYEGEEKNDEQFVAQLAAFGDIYVDDAFGVVHRKHASTYGIAKKLPSCAGFLLEKEILTLASLLETPKKPVVLLVGGAKIDTKIGVLRHFVYKADFFLLGGGLANTFLFAQGYNIGKSLYEKDKKDVAQEIIMLLQDRLYLPSDVVVADDISDAASVIDIPVEDVEGNMKILDIGRKTIQNYIEMIRKAGTVIWNGPMGIYEYSHFSQGTKLLAEAIAESDALSIVGGGDSVDALRRFDIPQTSFTHVSTGGGAMLEFLEGKMLPGIEVLSKLP